MQEWPYAKEPFDTRLFVYQMLKKIWLILGSMLVGAILVGSIHYLQKVVFGGPTEYECTTTYYIEYNSFDPVTGQMFNYTNDVTWDTWVISDQFVDKAWEYALEAGMKPEQFGVVKSDLKTYFDSDLASDIRIPASIVKTPHEELTAYLSDALQKVFIDFGVEQTEMDGIRIIDATPVTVADKDVRLLRACVLGAVVGLFVAVFVSSIMIIWDDSIILPDNFSYRYGLPMAGYAGKRSGEVNQEGITNLQYLFKDKENKCVLTVGSVEKARQVLEVLKKDGFSENLSASELNEASYEKLRAVQGILLLVEADAHNGREIEHLLQELKLQDCAVTSALLYQADAKLIHLQQKR